MKELREGEVRPIGSDKLMHDQELQHLVSSSIPSPPYSGLSLINTSAALSVLDPIYSAHLLASLAASNPGTRFQIPIPISMSVPAATPRMYAATIPVSGLTTTTHSNAQLDILSSWVNEQTTKDERKITATKTAVVITNNNNNNNNNNNKKRGTNFSVNKANKKNKNSGRQGLLSSENHIAIKKVDDNESDMDMKPMIIPIDKASKVGHIKSENGDVQPANNNNININNNNTKGNIQHQQSNQSRDKVFTCPICSRCFGYKHVLQNHERTHTGEKPYFCKICDKRFTRDHHLKTHMRLHTGEKPYNCTHCDRQFVQVANLRRHLRVHTGERPYSCELCSSRFSDSNQLKAHMLIHKGQKPYFCETCAGRFRRRHHLTHHKCIKVEDNKNFPHSPPDISPPNNNNKRERKSRETRRIIRVAGLPVATVTSGLDSFIPVVPEQTHPEDLSLGSGTGGLRNRNFSGSHSSVSASPSPTSGGSHGSLGPYCHSVSSSEPPEFYSDEERSGTADSGNSTSGKHDSDGHPSPLQG